MAEFNAYRFCSLDPMSLILSQNSNHHELRLATDSCAFERGPRYEAYAQLRESRLRMKRNIERALASSRADEEVEEVVKPMPSRKQIKFSCDSVKTRKGSSVLAQSVPDFSAVLRKENRKPGNPNTLPPVSERTPPSVKLGRGGRNDGVLAMSGSSRGSKSAGVGEKKTGLGLARKSYASVEDLRKISTAAATAIINGENRGKRAGGNGRPVLGYRHF